MRFVGRAAYECRLHFKFQTQRFEYFDCFGDDFSADAITGEDCDFHGVDLLKMSE
jgi:hypothetical protein